MNPTEIYVALSDIASKPFVPEEFPFEFARATDAAEAAIQKLRNGATNKSDIPGGVLFNRKFHFAPAQGGYVHVKLDELIKSKKNASAKPAILLTTDGEAVAAYDPQRDESLHFPFKELGEKFGFMLPAAGKERYRAVEENPIDIKATAKLARLYDALIKSNPDWGSSERRHEMNQFMMRLIFCLFAEDVGIFNENQFSQFLFTYAGNKGETAREALIAAFQAMDIEPTKRGTLPVWTHDLHYVNGGLFKGKIDAPIFSEYAFRYLREAADLNWREINPDIFGSMIQAVADPKERAELGMHYTSVSNIMKVIGPLFLDDLDNEIIKASGKAKSLHKLLERLEKIRIFDPACGSGNFLVVAYKQMREREMRILKQLQELEGPATLQMFSTIPIRNFYGIDITDFGVETAKLSLIIAEYQANARFSELFGKQIPPLPLRDSANIQCCNALRVDWETICPPPKAGEEVFIVGNPPFLGKAQQDDGHKADMDSVFAGSIKAYRAFDYVTAWFWKGASFIRKNGGRCAFVATNSICQGASASSFWPHILVDGLEIGFAHRSFKWSNNASSNAAVICVVVGIQHQGAGAKRLFDAGTEMRPENINAYLQDGANIYIDGRKLNLFELPAMDFGCMPYDAGNLLLDPATKEQLLAEAPEANKFVRKFMGSQEVVKGIARFCLWIDDEDLEEATSIPAICQKIENTRLARLAMKDKGGMVLAERPHQFREHNAAKSHSILVPRVTSERRPYLPVALVGKDVISSDANQVLYDAPEWCVALIASKLHLVWIATVCGKLKSDFRYSNSLGWNTFPVPKFTPEQLDALSASARKILKTRYAHYPKTIADLYDPDDMPDDLREVHRENDELLESMYIGRPFRNDSERLEHLFKLYAAKIKTLKKG